MGASKCKLLYISSLWRSYIGQYGFHYDVSTSPFKYISGMSKLGRLLCLNTYKTHIKKTILRFAPVKSYSVLLSELCTNLK